MVLKIEWRNQACVEKGLVAGDVVLVAWRWRVVVN
jgi:hypothetical protein